MTTMRMTTGLMAILLAAGCAKQADEQEVRDTLPLATAVQVNVPDNAAAPRTLGARAGFYVVTRDVSRTLNGGAAFVLVLAHTIVQYPVTTRDGDTLTWGPWSDSALAPNEWRFVATHQDDGDWAWSLDGRKKGTADFTSVVTGLATPGAIGRGKGTFHVDFDAARTLTEDATSPQGQLDVAYDLESSPKTLSESWAAPTTDASGTTDTKTFKYGYAQNADGSGDFQFSVFGDTDDPGPAFETTTIRSRWNATGAGRSDVSITGGDLGATTVTASECWDGSFDETYYTDSLAWKPTAGDEASCPYTALPPSL